MMSSAPASIDAYESLLSCRRGRTPFRAPSSVTGFGGGLFERRDGGVVGVGERASSRPGFVVIWRFDIVLARRERRGGERAIRRVRDRACRRPMP